MDADIFILIPVSGKLNNRIYKSQKTEFEISNTSKMLVSELEFRSKVECDEMVTDSLQRIPFEVVQISYYPKDDYESYDDNQNNSKKIQWIDAHTTLLYLEEMELGLLLLFIPKFNKKDITMIGDMISRKKIKICKNGRSEDVNQYIKTVFNLEVCNKIRTVYCMKKDYVKKKDIKYMFVGEVRESVDMEYICSRIIKNDEIEKTLNKNLSIYDNYDLYASNKSVIYCLKKFSEMNEIQRLQEESLLLFICEIAVLQNAALSRVNKMIVTELINDCNISTREALKLQLRFGKTILLWDNNIYNYFTAQKLSDNIMKIFETPRLFDEYKKNKEHIEQISSQKNSIRSGIALIMLNIVTFILNILQLSKLITNPKNFISYTTMGCFSILILTILVNKRRLIISFIKGLFK